LKPKRRRANAKQLEVLNRVFERTSFPTTQVRNELGQQLGMSPRTVQIWFQNRRQAIRMQEKKQ
ncbi:Homeodomain-like DNA binding domain-containing transcription factor, partial [Phycomyces blakesleeanus]